MNETRVISTKEEFDELLHDSKTIERKGNLRVIKSIKFQRLELSKQELKLILFEDCQFSEGVIMENDFYHCVWEGCKFEKDIISANYFHSCSFFGCDFFKTAHNLPISNNRFFSCVFSASAFNRLGLMDNMFYGCNANFDGKNLSGLKFNYCDVLNCNFVKCNIGEGAFDNSTLSQNTFSFTSLSSHTFILDESKKRLANNSIDIQTLIRSEPLSGNVLSSLFGIHEPDIKAHLQGMTSTIKLQSVFISYSFQDADFARSLNEALMFRGVLTFLWEEHAPGGDYLKDIMRNNIQKYDRLLFIASKHSLKSEACHFELTEGRKKQEKDWKAVLFPIHIDRFIFEVEKDQIRPLSKQGEYWENISELRTLNSLDFSDFSAPEIKNDSFGKAIEKLIEGLQSNIT